LLIGPFEGEDRPIPQNAETLRWLRLVFDTTIAAIPLLTASFDRPQPESFADREPSWIPAVVSLTGEDAHGPGVSITTRLEGAIWQHFRSFENGVGVYRLTPAIMQQCRDVLTANEPAMREMARNLEKTIAENEHREGLEGRRSLAVNVARAI